MRRRSALPASRMRAREARSSASSAPFSTASSVADAAARTSSGSSASVSSITIAATGRPLRSTGTHARPAPASGRVTGSPSASRKPRVPGTA